MCYTDKDKALDEAKSINHSNYVKALVEQDSVETKLIVGKVWRSQKNLEKKYAKFGLKFG